MRNLYVSFQVLTPLVFVHGYGRFSGKISIKYLLFSPILNGRGVVGGSGAQMTI